MKGRARKKDPPTRNIPPAASGFLGAPYAPDPDSVDAEVAILGVPYAIPYAMGQVRSAAAPDHIRAHSLRFLRAMNDGVAFERGGRPIALGTLQLVDCGNIPADPADVRAAVRRTEAAVRRLASAGAVPVILGGDDAVPIPVARGLSETGPLTVVQIDQHLDWADERDGNREGFSSPMRRMSEMPWIEQCIQIGLHGFGPGEQARAARAAGNLLIPAEEVRREGVPAILDRLPEGRRYFITVDLDGLDASWMPAVSHPEPGGLSYAEARDLLCGLAGKGRIVAMDWVEMVPAHDIHGMGAHAVCRLITHLLHAMQEAGQFTTRRP